jgi:positive regulator of sigma E activity
MATWNKCWGELELRLDQSALLRNVLKCDENLLVGEELELELQEHPVLEFSLSIFFRKTIFPQ